jgi:hypothetical protein
VDRNAATRTLLEKIQVKSPGTPLSQCRGRGFESHHLHQKTRSEAQGGIPRASKSTHERYVVCCRGHSFESACLTKVPVHESTAECLAQSEVHVGASCLYVSLRAGLAIR